MSKVLASILFFGLIAVPAMTKALSVELSIGYFQNHLNIQDEDNFELADLENEKPVMPHIALHTKKHYFGHSHFGYLLSTSLGWVDISHQKIEDKYHNFNTHLQGVVAYATPVLFFELGNLKKENSFRFTSGFGFGIGAGFLSGNSYLIDQNNAISYHQFNIRDTGISVGGFLEMSKSKWFTRASIYHTGWNVDERDYNYFVSDLSFGRRFDLHWPWSGKKDSTSAQAELH